MLKSYNKANIFDNFKIMKNDVLTVADLVMYIRESLGPFYPEREFNAMLFLIFEEVLGFSKTDIVLSAEATIDKITFKKVEQIIAKLKKMEPIQYVLGSTVFYGITIKTDARALIPRPETEELVSWVLESTDDSPLRVLDIGTGSGCIAIAIKKNIKHYQVLGIDLSSSALELAKENAENHKLSVDFFQVDILELSDDHPIKNIDIIVSNPPYIEYKDKKMMDKKVIDFEPGEALFVDNDNALCFYSAIGKFALKHLKIGGSLFFETSEYYNSEVVELLKKMGFTNIEFRKDINGKSRMIKALIK